MGACISARSAGHLLAPIRAHSYSRASQYVYSLIVSCLFLAITTSATAAVPKVTQDPVGSAQAQPSLGANATFTHITTEQGLSDPRVWSIVQDRAGFIWIGTLNGLDRYDGYGVVAYRNDP